MKKLVKKLQAGNGKNLLFLSGGTLLSQAFPFIVSPALTRIYSPDQFAILELILRISGLFAVIATFRFDIAIPLPKEDSKAINLFQLSILSTLSISIICTIFFISFSQPISIFLNNANIETWLIYIPILVFFSGISQCGISTLLRFSRYKLISFSKITEALLNSSGKIVLGILLKGSVFGLIFPNFIGLFFLAFIPIVVVINKWSCYLHLNLSDLKKTVKEYSDFPTVNLPIAIIDVLQLTLIVIIISHYFGSSALGIYALKLRILKTPTMIIGTSAGQIFYQTANKLHIQNSSILNLYKRYLIYFSGIGLLIFVPFIFLGPWIFSFVFGLEWQLAGVLAQFTAPWMFLNFIASALSYLPVLLKKQQKVFLFSLCNFVMVITSLILGYYIFGDFLETIILLSFVEVVYFIIVNFWYYRIVKNAHNDVEKDSQHIK